MKIKELEKSSKSKSKNKNDDKALLAFWEFKEETKEFDCIESREIVQPLPFKDMNYHSGRRCQKIFLYPSQSGEIFWFHPKNGEDGDIILNVLPKQTEPPKDESELANADQERDKEEQKKYQ